MKTIYRSLCIVAVLLLGIEDGCGSNADENDPYGHKFDEFRLQHGMLAIPPAWRAARPIWQKGVAWAPWPAVSKGYARKTLFFEPDGTLYETDAILSGRIVVDPDPDQGKVPEKVQLTYKIKDGKILEKTATTTLEGSIDFEEGQKLVLQWAKSP